jgi:2-keto-4-pentenoate hydratase/2-oxohepta-3-ene-1,7-dioic acid hydratase in catechol pathway
VPGLDVDDLAVLARVNGEVRQDGRTSQMVFDVAYLVSYVSEVFTLLPGDVILTGTPAGVGPLEERDVVEVEVEGIGVLRNPVIRR